MLPRYFTCREQNGGAQKGAPPFAYVSIDSFNARDMSDRNHGGNSADRYGQVGPAAPVDCGSADDDLHEADAFERCRGALRRLRRGIPERQSRPAAVVHSMEAVRDGRNLQS